ncbi:MAG TPA: universal stress protein [Acidobacteriota bacterium]|nr:universal stress protein [Acidobacteriota bacterium]
MPKMKHILLPIDYTPRTHAAVRYAAVLAGRIDASLTLLHVLPPVNPAWELAGGGGGGLLVQEALGRQKDDAERKLNAYLADELRHFEVQRMLAEGDPAVTVVDYAHSKGVDLIVMPTRGCGVFRRFLLGSVTAKVLHDARCPVLTTQHAEDVQPDFGWELRSILCAVNPGSGDEKAIHWAHGLASVFGAQLSIVHALPSFALRPETYYLESDIGRVLAQDMRERIEKMLSAAGIVNAPIYIQNAASVAKGVRSVAQDHRADLVVIGHSSGNGNSGRLRTDAYAIIRECPCPVVSV